MNLQLFLQLFSVVSLVAIGPAILLVLYSGRGNL